MKIFVRIITLLFKTCLIYILVEPCFVLSFTWILLVLFVALGVEIFCATIAECILKNKSHE